MKLFMTVCFLIIQSFSLSAMKQLEQAHVDYLGRTLLHAAAQRGDREAVTELLNNAADPLAVDKLGATPLSLALSDNQEHVVDLLLSHADRAGAAKICLKVAANFLRVPSPAAKDKDKATACVMRALELAKDDPLQEETVLMAKILLDEAYDINKADEKGRTLLHQAASKSYKDLVVLLQSRRARAWVFDNEGATPLHRALEGSHKEIVTLLKRDSGSWYSMHRAILLGNRTEVVCLLQEDGIVNERDVCGFTPLHVAALLGDKDLAGLLLAHGADVNAKDRNADTPLHKVVAQGNTDMMKFLVSRGALVIAFNKQGLMPVTITKNPAERTYMMKALKNSLLVKKGGEPCTPDIEEKIEPTVKERVKGDLKRGKDLLRGNGCEKDYRKAFDTLALVANQNDDPESAAWALIELAKMYYFGWGVEKSAEGVSDCVDAALQACSDMHLRKIAEILKDPSFDPRKREEAGTPLSSATFWGCEELVELLLLLGADVSEADDRGWTCLHRAMHFDHYELALFFVLHGAPVNVRLTDGRTPLYCAVGHKMKDVITALLEREAEVNVPDSEGLTPLHIAAGNRLKEIAELLIAKGADVKAMDAKGRTPLHLASTNFSTGIIELLLGRGADLKAVDHRGWTPLHYAADGHFLEMLKVLIAHGADLRALTNEGKTPFDLARNAEIKRHLAL